MISYLLKKHMGEENVNDICISIEIDGGIFPFAFIREETDEFLVLDSTDDNGLEKIVIIAKKDIISVSVVYQDDIDSIFESDEFDEKEKRLYQ